jgi:phosphohistidine phosphatase
MKTLHLLRHGKSSWEIESVKDIDRPLLERGMKNTYMMAERFIKRNPAPDLIITSCAIRAIHTAHIFARTVKYPIEKIFVTEKLFEASNEAVFDTIISVSNDIQNLVIVGHNPTFTQIANWYMDHEIENVHTSGLVSITFDCEDWKNIQRCDHKAVFESPKQNI